MTIDELIAGYHRFRSGYYEKNRERLTALAQQGQTPVAAVVGCCDSRVDPAVITDSAPGTLFVIRNVANLVPPCEGEGVWHGTSAALEFAVQELEVDHIVILGHARCGGIRALMEEAEQEGDGQRFIHNWMRIADRARQVAASSQLPLDRERRLRLCEKESIRISLENLMTFPWIAAKVRAGSLALHGWYYDLATGELQILDRTKGTYFSP